MATLLCEVVLSSFPIRSKKTIFVNSTTYMTRICPHIFVWTIHIQPVRLVMRLFTIVFERLPMVWFLLGLLFNATGLYLGFEHSPAFVYMIVGWACCAYGLAIFLLRLWERPRKSATTRLSANFISVGSTTIMPAIPNVKNERARERSEAE